MRRRLPRLGRSLPERLPDFLVLGATRSGSSFIHRALGQHPGIFIPERKGLNYFNRDGRYEPSLRDYRRYFIDYARQERVGESTPMYFAKGVTYDRDGKIRFDSTEDAVVRIARHMPDAQLIISLRDPMTRMVSQYEKNLAQAKVSAPVDEVLSAELAGESRPLNLLFYNDYETHLRHVFDHFPEDNVHILVFEEWTNDPQQALHALQSFLGVEPIDLPLENVPRNRRSKYGAADTSAGNKDSIISPQVRSAVLDHLEPSRDYVERTLGRKLPWADQATNR